MYTKSFYRIFLCYIFFIFTSFVVISIYIYINRYYYNRDDDQSADGVNVILVVVSEHVNHLGLSTYTSYYIDNINLTLFIIDKQIFDENLINFRLNEQRFCLKTITQS